MNKKLLFTVTLIISLGLFGCAKFFEKEPISEEGAMTQTELRAFFPNQTVSAGDTVYAPFNPKAIKRLDDKFAETLFDLGLTAKWRVGFDCNHFAALKMAVGQVMFVTDTFHKWKSSESVAIGEFWYVPRGNKPVLQVGENGEKTYLLTGHAINVVIVRENDKFVRKFLDIYSGKYMNLSETEIASAYLIKF